jgi:hypothetical protein
VPRRRPATHRHPARMTAKPWRRPARRRRREQTRRLAPRPTVRRPRPAAGPEPPLRRPVAQRRIATPPPSANSRPPAVSGKDPALRTKPCPRGPGIRVIRQARWTPRGHRPDPNTLPLSRHHRPALPGSPRSRAAFAAKHLRDAARPPIQGRCFAPPTDRTTNRALGDAVQQ